MYSNMASRMVWPIIDNLDVAEREKVKMYELIGFFLNFMIVIIIIQSTYYHHNTLYQSSDLFFQLSTSIGR